MEADYTKRELDMKFQALGEKVDENHKETKNQIDLLDRKINDKHEEVVGFLSEIKAQTMKTNGRVNTIESWRTGIAMCIAVFVFLVIPLVVYIYTNQVRQFNQQIKLLQTNSIKQ